MNFRRQSAVKAGLGAPVRIETLTWNLAHNSAESNAFFLELIQAQSA
jgi:hypothetical protein